MKRRGFTIVELLIYIGLFSTVLLVTTEIFIAVSDMYLETSATAALEHNATYLTKRLQFDILRATQIVEPANPGTVTNRLRLQINGGEYVYEIQNGEMILTAQDESNRLTTSEVRMTQLSVNRIGNGTATDSAQLQFTLQSQTTEANGIPRLKDYSLTATPR